MLQARVDDSILTLQAQKVHWECVSMCTGTSSMANGVTRINIAFPRRTLRTLRRCVRRGEYSRFVARAVELELARIRSEGFLRGAGALRVTPAHPFWDAIATSERIEDAERREIRRQKS